MDIVACIIRTGHGICVQTAFHLSGWMLTLVRMSLHRGLTDRMLRFVLMFMVGFRMLLVSLLSSVVDQFLHLPHIILLASCRHARRAVCTA